MSIVHAIGTAVPPHAYPQDYALSRMKGWLRDTTLQRMAHRVYRQSGIERRYSVLPDFLPDATPTLFHTEGSDSLSEPTTGQRNQVYAREYPALALEAAQNALRLAPWLAPLDITHVITASCTGFCNPGPDLYLAHALALAPSVERYHLGFMGCYAAFPALRMADQFCHANPRAVVLVVCVELCTLHLQVRPTPDSLLANALFADGAAAALVSARPPPPGQRALALDQFATRVIPETESAMAWTIGDRGFDMLLSSYVPRILGLHARDLLEEVLQASPVTLNDLAGWAIHPGGKAILSTIESHMGWPQQDGPLALSHRVLRDYGNMSSPTILFVLQALLAESPLPSGAPLGVMAFGPGLTVELGVFRMLGLPRVAAPPAPAACAAS